MRVPPGGLLLALLLCSLAATFCVALRCAPGTTLRQLGMHGSASTHQWYLLCSIARLCVFRGHNVTVTCHSYGRSGLTAAAAAAERVAVIKMPGLETGEQAVFWSSHGDQDAVAPSRPATILLEQRDADLMLPSEAGRGIVRHFYTPYFELTKRETLQVEEHMQDWAIIRECCLPTSALHVAEPSPVKASDCLRLDLPSVEARFLGSELSKKFPRALFLRADGSTIAAGSCKHRAQLVASAETCTEESLRGESRGAFSQGCFELACPAAPQSWKQSARAPRTCGGDPALAGLDVLQSLLPLQCGAHCVRHPSAERPYDGWALRTDASPPCWWYTDDLFKDAGCRPHVKNLYVPTVPFRGTLPLLTIARGDACAEATLRSTLSLARGCLESTCAGAQAGWLAAALAPAVCGASQTNPAPAGLGVLQSLLPLQCGAHCVRHPSAERPYDGWALRTDASPPCWWYTDDLFKDAGCRPHVKNLYVPTVPFRGTLPLLTSAPQRGSVRVSSEPQPNQCAESALRDSPDLAGSCLAGSCAGAEARWLAAAREPRACSSGPPNVDDGMPLLRSLLPLQCGSYCVRHPSAAYPGHGWIFFADRDRPCWWYTVAMTEDAMCMPYADRLFRSALPFAGDLPAATKIPLHVDVLHGNCSKPAANSSVCGTGREKVRHWTCLPHAAAGVSPAHTPEPVRLTVFNDQQWLPCRLLPDAVQWMRKRKGWTCRAGLRKHAPGQQHATPHVIWVTLYPQYFATQASKVLGQLFADVGAVYRRLAHDAPVVVFDYGWEWMSPTLVILLDALAKCAGIRPDRSIILHSAFQTIAHFENYVLPDTYRALHKPLRTLSTSANVNFRGLPRVVGETSVPAHGIQIRQAFLNTYWLKSITNYSFADHSKPLPAAARRHPAEEKYTFLLLGGKVHDWRTEFLARASEQDLLKDARWSYPLDKDFCSRDAVVQMPAARGAARSRFCGQLPKVLDVDSGDQSGTIFSDTASLFRNVRFSVTFETSMPASFAFVTEKPLKPINNFKPFIMLAPAHYMHALRMLGFRTYHPHINETYDTIASIHERQAAVVVEMQRLMAEPASFWNGPELAEIAAHNVRHLKEHLNSKLELFLDPVLALAERVPQQ